MRLYVDLETLQLIEGPGFRNPVTSLRFKRGDAAQLEVAFLTNGTTPAHIGDPGTLEIQFGIKPRGRYDVSYLVHEAVWTMPDLGAESPTYLASPSFNTVALDSAMQVGSSTGSELAEITLMGEITWREGSGEPTSTRTFAVIVENDVNRGTEGVPEEADPAYPLPASILTTDLLDQALGVPQLDGGGLLPVGLLPPLEAGTGAVRYDQSQALSGPQQEQARTNIEAFSGQKVGTAYLGGDLSGSARGTNAIDIQSGRTSGSMVASGDYGVAIGYSATAGASGVAIGRTPSTAGVDGIAIGNLAQSQDDYSIAIGYYATAYASHCVVLGEYASSSGPYSAVIGMGANSTGYGGVSVGGYGYCDADNGIVVGYYAYVYGESGIAIGVSSGVDAAESIAIGAYAYAAAGDVIAIGPNVRGGVANVAELGRWSSPVARDGAVRIHGGTGMVAMTIAQASAAFGADLSSAGSEVDGNLASGMTALRIHPTNKTLHIDWNDGGTIRSITLGDFNPS